MGINGITAKKFADKFESLPLEGTDGKKYRCSLDKDSRLVCYGSIDFCGKEYVLEAEYNTRYPYDIYYGCFCPQRVSVRKEKEVWEPELAELESVFARYWGNESVATMRVNRFYNGDNFFWAFWINIEDAEDISEINKGMELLVNFFKGKGIYKERISSSKFSMV